MQSASVSISVVNLQHINLEYPETHVGFITDTIWPEYKMVVY
jgi:hypothetical protein